MFLIVESWLTMISFVALPCWFILYRIPREMRRQFAREFAAYSRRVGMLGPFVAHTSFSITDNDDEEGFKTCSD